MKQRIAALFTLVTVFLFSCSKDRITGAGAQGSDIRTVNNFTGVAIGGSSNVYITKGSVFNVELKGYQNLLSHFQTRVENNILHLGYPGEIQVHNSNVEVFITMPAIDNLTIGGSGNISTTGYFENTGDFETTINGSGNISLDAGSTKHFFSTINGSGNIKAFNMVAENADVATNGSGSTEVTATQQLKVKINGSGNVYYKGSPVLSVDIAGSGKIIPR